MTHYIFLSHTFYGSIFRVGSHHLSEHCAAEGNPVWHISTPVTRIDLRFWRRKTEDQKVRHVKANRVHIVGNLSTWIPKSIFHPAFFLGIRLPKGLKRHISETRIILVDQPKFYIFLRLRARNVKIIYRTTDRPMGRGGIFWEKQILKIAHGVIAVSKECFEDWDSINKPKMLLPNGVSKSFITPVLIRKRVIQGAAVYVGALDDRVDWEFLRNVRSNSFIEGIDLFGGRVEAALLSEGLNYKGVLDYSNLQDRLQQYQFALMPFNDNDRNISRSPMKLYEYIACSNVVLSSKNIGLTPSEMGNLPIFVSRNGIFQINEINQKLSELNHSTIQELLENQSWDSKWRKIQEFADLISKSPND